MPEEEEPQEEMGYGVTKRKKKWYHYWEVWVLVVAFLAWVFFNNRIGNFVFEKMSVYVFGIIFFLFLARTVPIMAKHYSPKVVWGSGYTSYSGRFIIFDNFMMIRLGGVDVPIFGRWEGNEGTLIAPASSGAKLGKSIIFNASEEPSLLKEMNYRLVSYLIQKKYPQPYIMCYANEEQYIEEYEEKNIADVERIIKDFPQKPTVGHLITHLKEANRTAYLAFQQSHLKIDETDRVVKFGKRAIEAAGKKESLMERAFGREEEE